MTLMRKLSISYGLDHVSDVLTYAWTRSNSVSHAIPVYMAIQYLGRFPESPSDTELDSGSFLRNSVGARIMYRGYYCRSETD